MRNAKTSRKNLFVDKTHYTRVAAATRASRKTFDPLLTAVDCFSCHFVGSPIS